MKTSILRFFLTVLVTGALVTACSTEKDRFVNRTFHSVTTKYNVMYNGNLALDAGVQELALTPDNFWEILPVERMQIIEPVFGQDSVPRNANFKRAEDKAVKAIENHSMNIGGAEKNPQMDEAYLLLGKARYYDQRFIPALEAFNYILYKYPNSDKINEAKVWKEKTNIRLENNVSAIQNLSKLLKEINFEDRVIADANAILAQAYFNEERNDSAITHLKIAREYARTDQEKARYTFILGQLLTKQDKKEEAIAVFQEVIDMNRKSPREYVIQSHINQAKLKDISAADSVVFLEKFRKLLTDRENRPYLDALNHQLALYYDKQDNNKQAVKHYNSSLAKRSNDVYMVASNYRNLAEIYFYDAKYSVAGKYYDSTLVNLDNKTREFRNIRRKRENLDDVIKYEAIAVTNDSILSLVRMSEQDRENFFRKHIERLKEEDKKLKEYQDIADRQQYVHQAGGGGFNETVGRAGDGVALLDSKLNSRTARTPVGASSATANFYFYNQSNIAFGQSEFRKRWGNRPLRDYWRLANYSGNITAAPDEPEFDEDGNQILKEKSILEPRFTVDFYTGQIPTQQVVIDSLQKERNFAYYQLGIIYKDKFKEYELALNKLEDLLDSDPEERLILPSMYNLYRIYEILGSGKMASIRSEIMAKYPDSRYAQIINNPSSVIAMEGSAEQVYNSMFRIYQQAQYKQLLEEIEPLIDQYSGEQIISKLELLKANATGNLKGLEEYKKALNYVALTYPNSDEGKEAENILNTNIPKLEEMTFGKDASSWKLIHKTSENTDLSQLNKQLELFLKDRPGTDIKITIDGYTQSDNFVVIHNIYTEQQAKDIAVILSEYKDYKIREDFVVISSEDYKVVQIKKNFAEYLQKANPAP